MSKIILGQVVLEIIMSERTYFSLRYAIPGYALTLLVIGINHVPLLKFLEITRFEAAFGAFLAFLTLFTGSALGFLVSQFWWWWYKRQGGLYGIPKFKKEVLEVLVDKFGLPERFKKLQKNQNEDKGKIIVVYDYISHSEKKEKEALFAYSERRWDLYTLLSSTMWSLGIGLIVGIFCRIFFEYFLFESLFSIPLPDSNSIAELFALLSIFASVILLMFILLGGRQWVIFEYSAIAEARIRDSKAKRAHIRKAFPDIFAED